MSSYTRMDFIDVPVISVSPGPWEINAVRCREGVIGEVFRTSLTPLHCLWRPRRKLIGWDVKICPAGSCRRLRYAPFKETAALQANSKAALTLL